MGEKFWARRRVSWGKWVCQRRWRGGGWGKLDETVPSSGIAKREWIKPRGGHKRLCETLWGLIQPIGCRQREHVVLKKDGKARRGYHANENSKQFALAWQPLYALPEISYGWKILPTPMRRLDFKQEDQTNIKWSLINLENNNVFPKLRKKNSCDNGPAQLWDFPLNYTKLVKEND